MSSTHGSLQSKNFFRKLPNGGLLFILPNKDFFLSFILSGKDFFSNIIFKRQEISMFIYEKYFHGIKFERKKTQRKFKPPVIHSVITNYC